MKPFPRVFIERVRPEVEAGRFPIKRVMGEKVSVTADIFTDGHDLLSACLLYRDMSRPSWNAVPLRYVDNDRWDGEFRVTAFGEYRYTVEAWVDHFKSWQRDLKKKSEAGQSIGVDLLIGADLVEAAVVRASGPDARRLRALAEAFRKSPPVEGTVSGALSPELTGLMKKYPDREGAARYERELSVTVDRAKAAFSTWYERFPRSCSSVPGRHGTFKDCEAILPEIARMGFDVLYFPPIHPIGRSHRKGLNNRTTARPDDPGSPWAIGSAEGGHKSIHPELGTIEDFERLVRTAGKHGIEIALDLAFQCSPDHPYIKEHPEWFRWRPDGTIQYAENPPKKYEDIVPINFDTKDWKALWEELKSVILHWVGHGVRIFRVDNPHTKPFFFWEWVIAEVRREYPDVIFLAEAFTRPKVMYGLGKAGFAQSYTYFTWRTTKRELTEYLTELTATEVRDFYRPNFWPNTPDILPEHLQHGGRPAFLMRLVLAATLSSNYGIYGPAFELLQNRPTAPGKEEYLDSEKYEIKAWDWDAPGNLRDFIARVNRIRKENPALQSTWNLRFFDLDNDQMICYGKVAEAQDQIIVVVVNLDPVHTQSGWVRLPVRDLGIDPEQPYLVEDLLTEDKFIWHGERNFVQLNPHHVPAHIFKVRRHLKRETDFDYFM